MKTPLTRGAERHSVVQLVGYTPTQWPNVKQNLQIHLLIKMHINSAELHGHVEHVKQHLCLTDKSWMEILQYVWEVLWLNFYLKISAKHLWLWVQPKKTAHPNTYLPVFKDLRLIDTLLRCCFLFITFIFIVAFLLLFCTCTAILFRKVQFKLSFAVIIHHELLTETVSWWENKWMSLRGGQHSKENQLKVHWKNIISWFF